MKRERERDWALTNGWMVVLFTQLRTTGRGQVFFLGNIINLDVYNVEFAVYISGILMETSEGNGLYRYGSLMSK